MNRILLIIAFILPLHIVAQSRIEVVIDKDGGQIGFQIEQSNAPFEYGWFRINILGDWISYPRLKYFLWDLECRYQILSDPNEEASYVFKMKDRITLIPSRCACQISVQLLSAMNEIQKTKWQYQPIDTTAKIIKL